MPVEPRVFLCYGRPDREAAAALSKCFWEHQMECYDYLAKPIEDRLETELPHTSYIFAVKVFVALISFESAERQLVIEELQMAAGMKRLNPELIRIYVCPPEFMLPEKRPFMLNPGVFTSSVQVPIDDHPELYIDRTRVGTAEELCAEIIRAIPQETLNKINEAWEINKQLYPDQFDEKQKEYLR